MGNMLNWGPFLQGDVAGDSDLSQLWATRQDHIPQVRAHVFAEGSWSQARVKRAQTASLLPLKPGVFCRMKSDIWDHPIEVFKSV